MVNMISFVVFLPFLLVCGNTLTELQEFTNGNQEFTAKIYKVLSAQNGNFLVSPLSAELVLALVREGAKGDTFNQMTKGLSLIPSLTAIHKAIIKLLQTYTNNDIYKLLTANKLYIAQNFNLRQDFLNIARDIYKAGAENVNFTDVNTVPKINHWVEEKTNNKIQNLLKASDVSASTRLVLVNTLYFQGNWSKQFKTKDTKNREFYLSSGTTKLVPMMTQTSHFDYFEDNLAQYLELPYWSPDQNISMTIILPKSQHNLSNLNVNSVFKRPKFSQEFVQVFLPRFTVESTIAMVPILQQLGVKDLFSGLADLSGIAGNPGDLAVSNVVQKTFINVTEFGTEAAAATAVAVGATGGVVFPTSPILFEANKEFLYHIKVNDVVNFAGQLSDPIG